MRAFLGLPSNTSDADVVAAYAAYLSGHGGVAEPVSLAQAKRWLEIAHEDESHDAMIEALVVAAREWVEAHTGQVLTAREVTQTVHGFGPWLQLHAWPIRSVTTVAYSVAGATSVGIAADAYYLNGPRPARIRAVSAWPMVTGAEIKVTADAGYENPADVPQTLKLAIQLLVTRWFDTRGDSKDDVPPAVIALCRSHRLITV